MLLLNINISVIIHYYPNTTKGRIYSNDFREIYDKDIAQELEFKRVNKVRKIIKSSLRRPVSLLLLPTPFLIMSDCLLTSSSQNLHFIINKMQQLLQIRIPSQIQRIMLQLR